MAEEAKTETQENGAAPAAAAPVPAGFRNLLGEKLGMTQLFEKGEVVPVTALRAGPCKVVQVRTPEKDGYSAVQIGFGKPLEKGLNEPEKGHFAKAGVEPAKYLREFRLKSAEGYAVGQVAGIDGRFKSGDFVDVQGVTKGRGFAGVMKRHGFAGLPASHGASDKERSPGSLAARRSLGRVLPGQRMAGHMGHEALTIASLEIIKTVPEENLIYVRGAVPGNAGGLVSIMETTKPMKSRPIIIAPKVKKEKDPLKAAKAAAKGGAKKK